MSFFTSIIARFCFFTGFKEKKMAANDWKERVKEVLEEVRPALQRDGGDIELIEITDDGIVKVALQGHCAGCPMSQMTLKMFIEQHLKSLVPEVKEVVNV